jgi:hypothetical protein
MRSLDFSIDLILPVLKGRTTAQAVSLWFPIATAQLRSQAKSVGFVVDNVVLGQVFFQFFGFPCQLSFHRLLHIHHLSFRAGTISQLMVDVPSGLGLTPP